MIVNILHACEYLTGQTSRFLVADWRVSHPVGFCLRAPNLKQRSNSISFKPEQQVRKAKMTQKSLPPFEQNTNVMDTEAIIEESTLDLFCNLVYGPALGG